MKIIKRGTTKTSNQGNQENRKKRKCREGELLHCSPSCNTRYSMYKSSTSPTYFPTSDHWQFRCVPICGKETSINSIRWYFFSFYTPNRSSYTVAFIHYTYPLIPHFHFFSPPLQNTNLSTAFPSSTKNTSSDSYSSFIFLHQ